MKALRDNGLSLVLMLLFGLSLVGHALSGHAHSNDERDKLGLPPQTLGAYVVSGDFIETVFENWESEFLQMGMYLALTAVLFQRGSAESADPDDPKSGRQKATADSPWPVRRGGLWKALYSVSLTLAFLALFLVSFFLHAKGGAMEANTSTLRYMTTSKFWFESFQNWQSEFLSVAAMVVLSIWLRQRGSPESKPPEAPHAQTGT